MKACLRNVLWIAFAGLPLAAQQQFVELQRHYLPPGWAGSLAVGDVDGDGHVDFVAGNQDSQDCLYLGDGTGRFVDATVGRLPAHPARTEGLALVDVDRDGDLDLVLATTHETAPGGRDSLYLNDGTGRFIDVTATHMPAVDGQTYTVAVGDIDGDGDTDLVFGGIGIKLYINNGSGRFSWRISSLLRSGATPVALGDVDGDGDLDLATGGVYPQDHKLYLNNGAAWFTDVTATHLPPGFGPFAFADVDGDRDPDLIAGVVIQSRYVAGLFLNDGTGRFTDVSAARLPLSEASTVATGDVDGDGDVDLALSIGVGGANRLYLNDGRGTFVDAPGLLPPLDTTWTLDVVLVDVDGDRDLDLLGANLPENHLLLNNGLGSFWDTGPQRLPGGQSQSAVLADVDGDGDADLVTGLYLKLYENDGRGSFVDVTASRLPVFPSYRTYALAAADMDGDGDVDLVCGNSYLSQFSGQPNALYLNDGRGAFTHAAGLWQTSDDTFGVAVGDLDRDGDLDVVCANAGLMRRQDGLYLNDGTGRLVNATSIRLPVDDDYTLAVDLGDVDGDGDLDLVFGGLVHLGPGRTRLYLNDGSGTFTDATAARLPVDVDAIAVALGDVDGDRDLDLVLGKYGQDKLLLNDGTGSFVDVTATHLPVTSDSTRALALRDVDDDGDFDLVVANYGRPPTEHNKLYLNDGTGRFSDATVARMPATALDTVALAVGDVDGDGDADLFFGNEQYVPDRLYLNLLRQVSASVFAELGRSYTLDFDASPGFATAPQAVAPFVGLVAANPPIPLPPFGRLGLDPSTAIVLPHLSIPAPQGRVSYSFTIPAMPALEGVPLLAQAAFVHSGAVRLSNVHADPLRR